MDSHTNDVKNPAKLFVSEAKQDRRSFWTKTPKVSLESFGVPVFSSLLQKKGKFFGRWQSRRYCLHNDTLVYFQNSLVKGYTNLQFVKCTFYRGDEKKNSRFLLEKNGMTTILYTQDEKTFDEWQKHLRSRVILDDFNEKYREEKLLGKGTNAKVILIRERTTADNKKPSHSGAAGLFAAKELVKTTWKGKDKELLYNEIKMLRELDHPNITKLYEVHDMQKTVNFVMNLVEGGELVELMREKGCYTEGECAKVLKKLLETLLYLQKKRIVHRDIKPQNILIKDKNDSSSIVIADFGLACKMEDTISLTMRCGTPGHVAPEILNENVIGNYDKIDMFSIGCIFYRMLTGVAPFAAGSVDKVIKLNKECRIDYERDELKAVSSPARNLLQKMLEKEPNSRISVKDALKHEFFMLLNFGIEEKVVKPEGKLAKSEIAKPNHKFILTKNPSSGTIVKMNLQSKESLYAYSSTKFTPNSVKTADEDPIRTKKMSKSRVASFSPIRDENPNPILNEPPNYKRSNFSQAHTSASGSTNEISKVPSSMRSVLINNIEFNESFPVSVVFYDQSSDSQKSDNDVEKDHV